MKTAIRTWALVGTLVMAGGMGTVQAKKVAVDFSAFEGNYKAQPTTVFYVSEAYPVVAGIRVTVPKNGESATITVTGTLTASGIPYPLSNTFVLKKKTITIADILFSVPSPVGGATGTLTLNKAGNRISYIANHPMVPVPITGTIAVTKQGKKKKKLSLLLQISSGGTVYSFPIVGIAKVKPEKE